MANDNLKNSDFDKNKNKTYLNTRIICNTVELV